MADDAGRMEIYLQAIDGDASGDHKRFLFAFTEQQDSEPLHVILNWDAGL